MHFNKKNLRLGIAAGAAVLGGLATVAAAHRSLAADPLDHNGPGAKNAAPASNDSAPLTEEQRIVHVLNRLGFGPRPGDIQRVKTEGLDRYIEAQLHPENIDDSAVDKKLAAFNMLALSGDELSRTFYDRQSAFRQVQALRREILKEGADTGSGASAGTAAMAANGAPAMAAGQVQAPQNNQAAFQQMMAVATPEQQERIRTVRQTALMSQQAVTRAENQLDAAKMLRAVDSQRQLQEVMVDFWSNHFNIDTRKGACATLKVADDRDVIRPYALGKFRDLLGASAKSPAMLFYLDNYQSTAPRTPPNLTPAQRQRLQARLGAAGFGAMASLQGQAKRPQQAPRGGLNENYGREIMELHTLGVDGGYTQKDVTEVARCFTGWGLSRIPSDGSDAQRKFEIGGSFQFHPFLHDEGQKVVLEHVIPAGGGIQDGETVLDILASNPATMRHVSSELCQRLVADTPPASLVDRCVATWQRTDGDIREVVRTIVTSPEFYSRAAFQKKIKSPFEYAVSSVRALGGAYGIAATPGGAGRPNAAASLANNTRTLIGQVGTMGEPLFQYQAPTGYPEDSHKWVSSGALIARLNFSLALANGTLLDLQLPDNDEDTAHLTGPAQIVDQLSGSILHGALSASTRATLMREVEETPQAGAAGSDLSLTRRLTALVLGSPEFQRR